VPSSLIFVGLVVVWLLILVPAVARHQQEVARPSVAALSGRVLERPRPRRRIQEVDEVDQAEDYRLATTRPDADRAGSGDAPEVPVTRGASVRARVPDGRYGRDADRGGDGDREVRGEQDGTDGWDERGRSDEQGLRADAVSRDGEVPWSDQGSHRDAADRGDDLHRDDRWDGRPEDDHDLWHGEGSVDEDGPVDRDDRDLRDERDAWRRDGVDEHRWKRPPPRYRPGRGGFDPEAAALAARARYAFRQRVVLGMLVTAVVTAVVAAVAVPVVWWAHAAVDLALVGYLGYLRRQVRMEEAIRARRAARMAGTRLPPAAEDPDLDGWARRGREVSRHGVGGATSRGGGRVTSAEASPRYGEHDGWGTDPEEDMDADHDLGDEPGEDLQRVRGTGEPVAPPHRRADDPALLAGADAEPALPRLDPTPPPPLPAGTALVEADEEDAALHDLEPPPPPDYRRAAGE
jgi:hypothetical protein